MLGKKQNGTEEYLKACSLGEEMKMQTSSGGRQGAWKEVLFLCFPSLASLLGIHANNNDDDS